MSEKITFKELVELIASQSDQSRTSANSFIHELVRIIESGLKQGGEVSISGFGKFELRWMNERPGINPQTGEEITIPGQNKVVFKPFKNLRESVNKPYSGLESRVLDESPETQSQKEEESKDAEEEDELFTFLPPDSSRLSSTEESDESDPFGIEDTDTDEPDPFGLDDFDDAETIDDLVVEREHPYTPPQSSQAYAETAIKSAPVAEAEPEEDPGESDDSESIKAPILPDESKLASEAQKSGSYKWSYAAAVIIVMIAFIILFYMMQQNDETGEIASGDQTEQVITPPADETVSENEQDQATEEESEPPDGAEPATDTEPSLETFEYSVNSGESLWTIAERELGNPYLWPLIYHLNKETLGNPNQITENSSLSVPTISDPDNLNQFEREQVAMGYFSLYEWNRENNPDQAQYFLWAVGVFSQDLLDNPPSEVNAEDLEFARNR